MLGSIVTIEEREGLLIEVIITTRVANPCGFKARVRQLFLFSKKKISHFLSKESNKQRNNCNECVEIHYGLLVGVFLPTPNLIAKKKAQPPKRLS